MFTGEHLRFHIGRFENGPAILPFCISFSIFSVQYSSFDKAISIAKKLDKKKNALIGKMDIKAAFRLLPVYPGDFNLLGLHIFIKVVISD
jgi:hypothetical protein